MVHASHLNPPKAECSTVLETGSSEISPGPKNFFGLKLVKKPVNHDACGNERIGSVVLEDCME